MDTTAGFTVTVPFPSTAVPVIGVVQTGLVVKVAVTAAAALRDAIVHPLVPVHPAPLQPAKVEPADAAAVSVGEESAAKFAEQVAPHEIPAGALVTVPVPAPALVTATAYIVWANVAVTLWAELTVKEQVPVPEHPPPLQPVKLDPAEGAALNTTEVVTPYVTEHVVPQLIPAGALVTAPVPAPARVTVNESVGASV